MAKLYVGFNLVKDFVNEKIYEFSSEWLDHVMEMLFESIERSLRKLTEEHSKLPSHKESYL